MEWIAPINTILTQDQMKNNVQIINVDLTQAGWTINAIAGVLGNFERESWINPSVWQNFTIADENGYGLAQWTPSTKYSQWAGSGWDTDHDKQLSYLKFTMTDPNDHNYIETSQYPYSKTEYVNLTLTPEEMASIFLYNYERAGEPYEDERRRNARKWYEYLGGLPPSPMDKKKMKYYLYFRRWY